MMESPGKILKKERETRNISLEKICSFTKIKEHHLKALEEDRYELLPHSLYVKGYLKSYARYLTLDEKNILGLYEDYLKSLLPPDPPPLPLDVSPPKKSVRLSPFSLTLSMFLFTMLFMAYLLYNPTDENSTPSPFFSVSPATAIQREESQQTPHVAQLKETQELNNLESKEEMHSIPAFQILEAGMGRSIEKENDQQFLTGNASEFTTNDQRGYFFTRVKASRTGIIAHVWLCEGKEFHRIEMEIRGFIS